MEQQRSIKIKSETYLNVSEIKLYLEKKHNFYTISRAKIMDLAIKCLINKLKEDKLSV